MSNDALNEVINLTVVGTQPSLQPANVNDTIVFCTEQADSINDYEVITSASQVGAIYGTNSTAKKMADAIFAQDTTIRMGNGNLFFAPLNNAVSATSGKLETADISANLANFQAVSDGGLKIIVDGTTLTLRNLDFTATTSLVDVASVIQKKLIDVDVSYANNKITIASKSNGTNSTISIITDTGAPTDISGANYLNDSGATETAGVNASGETIVEAMARIDDNEQTATNYVNVLTDLRMEGAVVEALATTIQAKKRILFYGIASKSEVAGLAENIRQASNRKTQIFYDNQGLDNLHKLMAGGVSRHASVNYDGSRTANTLATKIIRTALPSKFTTTLTNDLKAKGVDYYVSYGGRNGIRLSGANQYHNVVRDNLALGFEAQVALFNVIGTSTTKISQTEAGMDRLKAALRSVFNQFVTNGVIGTGLQWNGDRFGDDETMLESITQNGYYIFSQPISEQSQADRELRKAQLIQAAYKLAGSIEQVDAILTFEV